MPRLKDIIPIAGSMVAALLIGFTGALALVVNTGGTFWLFFLAVLVVAGGFAWWWRRMDIESARPRSIVRPEFPPLPAYVLPADIDALLDQHLQCVNAFIDTARTSLDIDGRLRARMGAMAAYVTSIEDELEQLRIEADKVQEIQQVATRTPRLTSDAYGVRAKKADEVPAFLLNRDLPTGKEIVVDWPQPLAPASAE